MKTSIISKSGAVLISLFMIFSQALMASNFSQTLTGQITAVYDYANYGFQGSYSTVTNPVTQSISHVYSNGSETGHPGLNANATLNTSLFIPTSISYFNSNGMISRTQDLLNNTFTAYNNSGQVTSSYSWVAGPHYDPSSDPLSPVNLALPATGTSTPIQGWICYQATVTQGADGPGTYSITRKGTMTNSIGVLITVNGLPNGDPAQFQTSVEHYDSLNRLTEVDTYQLENIVNQDANTGVVIGGYTIYQYSGNSTNLTLDNTYVCKDAGTKNISQDTHTQQESYIGGRIQKVTAFNADGTSYTSAKYFYDGTKLKQMEQFKSTSDTPTQIVYYDQFGRQSEIDDPNYSGNGKNAARLLESFIYNDGQPAYQDLNHNAAAIITTSPNYGTEALPDITNTVCVLGGLLTTRSYTYAGEEGANYTSYDDSFYNNGDQTKTAFSIHSENPTGILASLSPSDQTPTTTSNLSSTLQVLPDGEVKITLTGASAATNFLQIINSLQNSLDANAHYDATNDALVNGATDATVTSLLSIRNTLTALWESNGNTDSSTAGTDTNGNTNGRAWTATGTSVTPTTINVAIINPAAVTTAPSTYAPTAEFEATGVQNQTAYSNLVANLTATNNLAADITANYWAVDDAGNIWVFAEAIAENGNSTHDLLVHP